MQKIYSFLILICIYTSCLYAMEESQLAVNQDILLRILRSTIDTTHHVRKLFELTQKLQKGTLTVQQACDFKIDDNLKIQTLPLMYVKMIQVLVQDNQAEINYWFDQLTNCIQKKTAQPWLGDKEHTALCSQIENGNALYSTLLLKH